MRHSGSPVHDYIPFGLESPILSPAYESTNEQFREFSCIFGRVISRVIGFDDNIMEAMHLKVLEIRFQEKMSDCFFHDPVPVVVSACEVDEHDPPPPARARIPHRLPVEGERRPDRPAAVGNIKSGLFVWRGGSFKCNLCRTPALLARIPVTKTSSIHKLCCLVGSS